MIDENDTIRGKNVVAVIAYREAQKVFTRKALPQQWAIRDIAPLVRGHFGVQP